MEPDDGDEVSCVPEVHRVQVEPDGTEIPFVVGLPDWLSYDDATRTFSGTPTALDTEHFTITMFCHDHFSAQLVEEFDFIVWGIQFKPGLPRVRPGSLDAFSYEVEVGFSPDVVALDGTTFLCAAFPEGVVPRFIHSDVGNQDSRGPVPASGFVPITSERGPVDGNNGTGPILRAGDATHPLTWLLRVVFVWASVGLAQTSC